MFLTSIKLLHFKNHPTLELSFSPFLNVVTGPNGTGKTNLLDAIYFLCNTKSAFLSSDSLAIQHGYDFLRIEGHFQNENKASKIECIIHDPGGKTFLIDNKPPEKLSGYIGKFPVVLVSPYDTDLIREGSETRRKFFDLVLSQYNGEYLEKLMQYNKILKQRNALLKQFAETGKRNVSLLSVYDTQLIPLAVHLSEERKKFIQLFVPLAHSAYNKLATSAETMDIQYRSDCMEGNFTEKFYHGHHQDFQAQRTTIGIHCDDYEFTLNNMQLKKYGSQGQQKTFVLALKLAHFEFLKSNNGKKPLLLLDDIFDRLDEQRVSSLALMVEEGSFGQVFITDATPKRILSLFKDKKGEMAIFKTSQ